jgi:hypothetical protein
MDFTFDELFARKTEYRKKLSEQPFLDKVVVIKRMQGRTQILKSAKNRAIQTQQKVVEQS